MVRVVPRASRELRCAVCHGPASGASACPRCGTLTHDDCSDSRCPTLGCALRPRVVAYAGARGRASLWRHLRSTLLLGAIVFVLLAFAIDRFKTALQAANGGHTELNPEIMAQIPGG